MYIQRFISGWSLSHNQIGQYLLVRSEVIDQFLLVCPEGQNPFKRKIRFLLDFLYFKFQVFFYIRHSKKNGDDGL